MRILLVEDERKVASFIARALKENTYAVDVAETGQKALELGADVTYDAILLDVRLPDLSGIEVCREFRQRGIEAPVLMLTARGLIEQRVEGLDAGALRLGRTTCTCEGTRSAGLPWQQRKTQLRGFNARPSSPPRYAGQRDNSSDVQGIRTSRSALASRS